jgi:hypothetical protein
VARWRKLTIKPASAIVTAVAAAAAAASESNVEMAEDEKAVDAKRCKVVSEHAAKRRQGVERSDKAADDVAAAKRRKSHRDKGPR